MPHAVDCDLFLYSDDTCLLFQHPKRIKEENPQNFFNIIDWYADNTLSIHFGEDKLNLYLSSPETEK